MGHPYSEAAAICYVTNEEKRRWKLLGSTIGDWIGHTTLRPHTDVTAALGFCRVCARSTGPRPLSLFAKKKSTTSLHWRNVWCRISESETTHRQDIDTSFVVCKATCHHSVSLWPLEVRDLLVVWKTTLTISLGSCSAPHTNTTFCSSLSDKYCHFRPFRYHGRSLTPHLYTFKEPMSFSKDVHQNPGPHSTYTDQSPYSDGQNPSPCLTSRQMCGVDVQRR